MNFTKRANGLETADFAVSADIGTATLLGGGVVAEGADEGVPPSHPAADAEVDCVCGTRDGRNYRQSRT